MTKNARGWVSMMALGLGLVLMAPGAAQAGGGGGGGGGGGFAQIDTAQMQQILRQRVLGNVKTQVGFTDEEWTIIEPKLWRVAQLQIDTQTGALGSQVAQLGGGGGGAGGGARGGGGGRGGGGLARIVQQAMNSGGQPSAVQQTRQAMEDVLAVTDAPQQLVASKLEEYRGAWKKAKADLVKAQDDLQGVVTIRQEALLVEAGFLD